jgi:hypothetical protein
LAPGKITTGGKAMEKQEREIHWVDEWKLLTDQLERIIGEYRLDVNNEVLKDPARRSLCLELRTIVLAMEGLKPYTNFLPCLSHRVEENGKIELADFACGWEDYWPEKSIFREALDLSEDALEAVKMIKALRKKGLDYTAIVEHLKKAIPDAQDLKGQPEA